MKDLTPEEIKTLQAENKALKAAVPVLDKEVENLKKQVATIPDLMEETAKYPPQSYTQKLLDAGVIEFQENDIDEEIP